MDCVFAPSEQSKFWIQQTGQQCEIVHDFVSWTMSTDRRVAVVEVLNFDDTTHDLIDKCCIHGDLVFIVITEFISDCYCQEFDLPNVIFVLNGTLNWSPEHAQIVDGMYFFWSTCDFYRRFPDLLQDLDGQKDRVFDVLLGRRKLHRDWIYNTIDRQKNIVTYFPGHEDQDIRDYTQEQFQWPQDILPRPEHPVEFTVQEVTVDGTIVSLSQIIPREIYQRTHYTLVAETVCDNAWSFPTEKIVKPILAQRLFLVYAGHLYLTNLQRMGFHTFHGIIDESYDQEPDAQKRMDMLMGQVEWLQQQDPVQLQPSIARVAEHNYRIMTMIDWQGSMIAAMSAILRK